MHLRVIEADAAEIDRICGNRKLLQEFRIQAVSLVIDRICPAAALLLGAKNVVGVDIDELAVKTAIENGKVNSFTEPEYKILQGNLTDKVTGTFDIVVANIVADVIIMFSEFVGDFMKDGSYFITSGIIAPRENEVRDALNKNGFEIIEENRSGDWLCFVCTRR